MGTGYTGVTTVSLRGVFPGLGTILTGLNAVMAANAAHLHTTFTNEAGQVSLELRVPRNQTPLLTVCLDFVTQEQAKVFSNLAGLRFKGLPKYCFLSEDDCSIVAVPTSDYRELFDIYELPLPSDTAQFATTIELRKPSAGLDVILNVLTRMLNSRNKDGSFLYRGVASLSSSSKVFNLTVTKNNSTILVVSFQRQFRVFDHKNWMATSLLNGAIAYNAPILLTSEDDLKIHLSIGTPLSQSDQFHLKTFLQVLENSTPAQIS